MTNYNYAEEKRLLAIEQRLLEMTDTQFDVNDLPDFQELVRYLNYTYEAANMHYNKIIGNYRQGVREKDETIKRLREEKDALEEKFYELEGGINQLNAEKDL